MKKELGLYCAWASSGLALHNSGRCLLCCHSQTYLKDENNEEIYLDSGTIEQAWHSPTRKQIQDDLENGIQHPNCSACWNEEAAGRTSRRQVANQQFKDVNSDAKKPLLVDLKPGNTCNLACRTCWPEVSSKWYRDYWEIEDKKRFPEYKLYLDRWSRIRTSYDRDNLKLWSDLDYWLEDVIYFDIYGAEPMLLSNVFDILKKSVDSGKSKEQSLHINTNATIWNQNYIDILTHFKQVVLDLSIDGIGDHYDYIRYGETWNNVEPNIERYRQLANLHKNIKIHVCITVSSLNVLYSKQIQQYFCDRKISTFFNMVHHPQYINVRSLPSPVKQLIRQILEGQEPDWQINGVLNFMDMPIENQADLWKKFWEVTEKLDQLRNQNIKNTFPVLYAIIKPYKLISE
jgi:sulfatase maturation enzyme AslB (radical SAM superfamily)